MCCRWNNSGKLVWFNAFCGNINVPEFNMSWGIVDISLIYAKLADWYSSTFFFLRSKKISDIFCSAHLWQKIIYIKSAYIWGMAFSFPWKIEYSPLLPSPPFSRCWEYESCASSSPPPFSPADNLAPLPPSHIMHRRNVIMPPSSTPLALSLLPSRRGLWAKEEKRVLFARFVSAEKKFFNRASVY